jgi:hypothetical protein
LLTNGIGLIIKGVKTAISFFPGVIAGIIGETTARTINIKTIKAETIATDDNTRAKIANLSVNGKIPGISNLVVTSLGAQTLQTQKLTLVNNVATNSIHKLGVVVGGALKTFAP